MTVGDGLVSVAAQALSSQCRLKAGGECVRYARVALTAALATLAESEPKQAPSWYSAAEAAAWAAGRNALVREMRGGS